MRRVPTLRAAAFAVAAALLAWPAAAGADHGFTYRGHYGNALVAGKAADGRQVLVMAGHHTDFPYHDPGSTYDQVAVRVGKAKPVVVTARPHLDGLRFEPAEDRLLMSYAGERLTFELDFHAVRHPRRYEGDPADLGDLLLGLGAPDDHAPGFVYTPYELIGLRMGRLVVDGQEVRLSRLHGQGEEGQIDAPDNRNFQSAYNYLAAAGGGLPRYAYVGFRTRALHPDSPFDAYLRETASDEFTMQDASIEDGNRHGVPEPFDNTQPLPPGVRSLGAWDVDLGPGVLHRRFVRLRDGAGRKVLALSETIKRDG